VLKKILDPRLITLLDQMVFSGTNFLMTIILTQLCSPEEFGKYSLVFMLMMFGLGPFRNFTVEAMMANPFLCDKREYLSSTLLLSFGFIVFFGLILGGFLHFFGEDYEIGGHAWIIYFFCVSRYYIELTRGYFFTYKTPLYALLVDVLCSGTVMTSLYQSHIGGLTYIDVLQIISTAYILSFVVGMIIAKPSITFKKEAIKTNLKFGRWLCLTGVFAWFNGNFLLLIAVNYLGTFVAGAVRAISNLLAPIGLLLHTIENYIPVRAAGILHKEGHRSMGQYLFQQSKWTSLIFLPIFIVISLSSALIISALFGDSYIPYKDLIPFLVLAQVFGFYGRYLRIALRTINYTRPIFFAYACTAMISILLSGTLIETFGFIGIGFGIMIFQITLLLFMFFSLRSQFRKLDLKPPTTNIS